MAKIFYERDADTSRIRAKKVAIIGYGSQGRAHALNLSDSGVDVRVGLRHGSERWAQATFDGAAVGGIAEVTRWADVIAMLVPDAAAPRVFADHVAKGLAPGKSLIFSHGMSVRIGALVPPPFVDVALVAPKGPGRRTRDAYVDGAGVPALVAVHQDASGGAREDALSYAMALGASRAWVLLASFREATEWRYRFTGQEEARPATAERGLRKLLARGRLLSQVAARG